MRTKRLEALLVMLTATLTVHLPVAHAAGYKIDWQTVDGGGGNCSGGKFSLSATAGQPDAGLCTGGAFVHQGGFLPAFQKTVLPPLRVVVSGNQITHSWPNVCTDIVLEGTPNLNGSTWTALGNGTVVGTDRQVVVSKSSPYHFFRLRKDCPQ